MKNVNFTINSKSGDVYDVMYAGVSKNNNNLPLYYITSKDDDRIKNKSYIFIDDNNFDTVSKLFNNLSNWRKQIETNQTQIPPVPASPAPAPAAPAAPAPAPAAPAIDQKPVQQTTPAQKPVQQIKKENNQLKQEIQFTG